MPVKRSLRVGSVLHFPQGYVEGGGGGGGADNSKCGGWWFIQNALIGGGGVQFLSKCKLGGGGGSYQIRGIQNVGGTYKISFYLRNKLLAPANTRSTRVHSLIYVMGDNRLILMYGAWFEKINWRLSRTPNSGIFYMYISISGKYIRHA